MERLDEFYSELYDSGQAVTIQTYPDEVPPLMAWEVKQLAKLYTKCITERRIPKTWKEANMVIFFKKGNRKDITNYKNSLFAIKYVHTVHKNNNNYAGEETR